MEKYTVTNRSTSLVYYSVPDLHINRQFTPGETKTVTKEELEGLSYQPGGAALISNYLRIQEQEGIDTFVENAEPEYYLDEAGVKKLIQSGSLDEFLDCLDFAPEGVLDMIKTYSISMPMTDTQKAQALKDKTGFDVMKAVANDAASKEDAEPAEQKVRRAAPKTEGRRYNRLG